MLSITREEFRHFYRDTDVLKYEDWFFTEPETEEEFEERLSSKLWRMNNIYRIVDKFGKRVVFRMNRSQHKVYGDALRHPRVIILKSRQQGISTFFLVLYFDDAITRTDLSIGLMAQGLDESSTLLERTEILWNELDDSIKDFLEVRVVKDSAKEYGFSTNSSIFIRTSFRSTTLQRLHISEFGKIANNNPKRARETFTGTMQAIAPGNICAIESTAEGDNRFKSEWDKAYANVNNLNSKSFYPIFLSWLDDPDCVSDEDQDVSLEHAEYFKNLEEEVGTKLTKQQKNFWIIQEGELGKEIFQEYPATPAEAFLKSRDGTYYTRMYMGNVRKKGREVQDLFEPRLPVHIAVDLGMNDDMYLTFFQEYKDGCRIIDVYKNSGHGIDHYCDIIKDSPYADNVAEGTVLLPHDAEVRDLSAQNGITREQVFHQNGIRNTKVLPKMSVNEGIELVRQLMKELWIDPTKASDLVTCILNYTKEWDDKLEVWKDKPRHDKYSHGADTLKYLAQGRRKFVLKAPRKRKRGAVDL